MIASEHKQIYNKFFDWLWKTLSRSNDLISNNGLEKSGSVTHIHVPHILEEINVNNYQADVVWPRGNARKQINKYRERVID